MFNVGDIVKPISDETFSLSKELYGYIVDSTISHKEVWYRVRWFNDDNWNWMRYNVIRKVEE